MIYLVIKNSRLVIGGVIISLQNQINNDFSVIRKSKNGFY